MGSYMADAQKMISEKLPMPNEYTPAWSGQHEIIQQNSTRWKIAGLIALVTIILLRYAASRSWLRTLIVLLTVRFSVAGAIWFL
jgi:Cu(I)/Ag(I) efflux system membrane protein CusA/SilA